MNIPINNSGQFLKDLGYRVFDRQLLLNASALSYTTVLLLIPLLALTLWSLNVTMASYSPQQTDQVIDRTISRFVPQIQLLKETHDQSKPKEAVLPSRQDLRREVRSLIQTFGTGVAGTIALITLFVLVGSLAMTLEYSLNVIWDLEGGRPFWHRIGLYFVLHLGVVFVLMMVITTNTFLHSQVVKNTLGAVSILQPVLRSLLSFVILVLSLICIYKLVPHTRVTWKGATWGALTGGILIHLNSYFHTIYTWNLASARAIYGSLAILPLFLLGLYITWLVILLGATVCYELEKRMKSYR